MDLTAPQPPSASPTGKSSQWAEDTEVMVRNFPLKVGKKIGEGLTANIYRGVYRDNDVVVKVMKVDTGVDIRSYFASEGKYIAGIRRDWEERYPGELQVVPEIFADESGIDEPYLVMELIKGQDFEKLLEQRTVTESEALTLGVQIGKLLITLNEGLKKSYADIKFDNFWLLDARDERGLPRLKVIDWNILSDTDAFKVRRDLFYATVYLFRILTGAELQFRGIQLRTRLAQVPGIESLTIGMRRFFQRALHPDFSHRFSTAQEWLAQINELQQWWLKEPGDLNMAAGRELDAATQAQNDDRSTEALDAFNRARDILDISDRKGRGSRMIWSSFFARIQAGLESTSDLETGLNLLKTWQFGEAQNRFKRGADLSMAEPERLLRWYWLATAGLEMGRENFRAFEMDNADGSNDLITGVQALLDGNTVKAEEILGRAAGRLDPPPAALSALLNEARVLNLASRAQSEQARGEYQGAAETYERAYRLWADLPENPRTAWAETIGNVFQLWEDARRDANTLGVAREETRAAREAVAQGNYDLAGEAFERAFKAADDFPETVKAWAAEGAACLQYGRVEDALLLVRPALGYAAAKEAILPLWQAGQQINRMIGMARDKRIEEATAAIEQYCAAHTGDPVALGKAFQQAVGQVASVVMSVGDMDLFDRIAIAAGQYNLAISGELDKLRSEYQNQLVKRRQTRVEEIWQEVFALHEQKDRAASKQAEQRLAEMQLLMTDDECAQPHWQGLFNQVRQRREDLDMEHQQLEDSNSKRLDEIKARLAEIDKTLDRDKDLADRLDLNNARHRKFYEEIVEGQFYLVRDALVLLQEWKQIVPSAEEPETLAAVYRKRLETPAINAVKEMYGALGERLETGRKTLSDAEAAFKAGQLPECFGLLDTFEAAYGVTPESTDLRGRAKRAQQFSAWMSGFNQRFSTLPVMSVCTDPELAGWMNQKLPAVFWKQQGATLSNWLLTSTQQGVDDVLRQKQGDTSRVPEKLGNLVHLHRLDTALKAAQGQQAGGSGSDLQDLVKVAYQAMQQPADRRLQYGANLIEILNHLPANVEANPGTIRTHLTALENQARRSKRTMWLGIAIPVGIVALVAVGLIIWKLLPGILGGAKPTETIAPTQTVAVVSVLTNTPVPPTATNTPVPPTETPTPIPTSVYMYPEKGPEMALPVGVTAAYLLDDANAKVTGPEGYWEQIDDAQTKAVGGSLRASNKETTEEASILLTMDQPLPEAGLYELFVSDTASYSRTISKPFTFEVGMAAANGDFIPIQPVKGANQVVFKGNSAQPNGSEWTSIGTYEFKVGDTIGVRFTATGQIEAGGYGAMDAILITRLPALPDEAAVPLVKKLQEKGELAYWVDDSSATMEPAEGWQRTAPNSANWLGESKAGFPSAGAKPVQMTYGFHKLDPGKYDLYAWISAELNGKVDYSVKLDGVDVAGLIPMPVDSESGVKSTLVKLGTIEITDAAKPNLLTVVMKPNAASATGVLAGDVIALVKVP